jgi:hypothetical protein
MVAATSALVLATKKLWNSSASGDAGASRTLIGSELEPDVVPGRDPHGPCPVGR